MAQDASGDNRHFEEVLHRLDALMKRNQAGGAAADDIMTDPPAFVILPPPAESWADDVAAAPPAADGEEDIPLLTEVYPEELPPPTPADGSPTASQDTLQALLPPLLEALDHAIREETARLREALAARLKQQLADLLQELPVGRQPPDRR